MENFLSLLLLLGYIYPFSTQPLHCKRPHIVFMVADDLSAYYELSVTVQTTRNVRHSFPFSDVISPPLWQQKWQVMLYIQSLIHGWNDVSFHGSKQIPTPNIDAIARDGIILNQYYVQPICSPSRGSLMTGKYAIRIGFQHTVISANSPWGLPLKEKILPQYLKEFGYSTHAVGKWHLGFFKEEYLPTRRGFNSFFGYYTGGEDYYTHAHRRDDVEGLDLHENGRNIWNYNGTYGADLFTSKAKKVIYEHNSSQPLFLYFAQQSPHSGNFFTYPLQAPHYYVDPMIGIEDEKRKIFAGMVSSLDYSVGEIFEALDITGMLDDTIFIFTSDNGGAPQEVDGTSGSNWPLKGSKYTLWEGGVRVPAFIWSPLLRQGSRIHNELMHITDWLPTILSAVGGWESQKMLPEDTDGIDQWSSIAYDIPSYRSEILINIDDVEKAEAIRRGRYKYVKGSYLNGKYDKWYDEKGKDYKFTHSPQALYNYKELYSQNYLRFLSWSKAATILWYKYDKDPLLAISCQSQACTDSLEVKCGVPPPTASTCNAMEEACLFDIIADPCEYYNIAPLHPEIIKELEKTIKEYRTVAIPPKDLPKDDMANPIYHGNAWVPWK